MERFIYLEVDIIIDRVFNKSSFIQFSHLLIVILGIWFSANLISQLLFISHYGNPYDVFSLLVSLGPIYVVIIIAELILWIWLIGFFIIKILIRLRTRQSNREIGDDIAATKTAFTH